MLQRFNWRIVCGIIFIVAGFLALFKDGVNWTNAGSELLLGVGLLGTVYADKYPERARGPVAWVVVIIWGIALIWFTFIRFQR